MKIGVEEEFIVVNPDTLWITPGSFRLANSLIYRDGQYVRKCNVELPLHSGSISKILSHLSQGFCVFELKTDPYLDIEDVADEIQFHREHLIEVARENHLMILPCGVHPAHRSVDFIDNCAAFQVHVDYTRDRFERLRAHIPFLISISGNSPFFNGTVKAKSNRMRLSPHVNVARKDEVLKRNTDILYNPTLRTVEVKVFDSQITTDESLGLASIVRAIAENPDFTDQITETSYKNKRKDAIQSGEQNEVDFITEHELFALKEYNVYASKKLSEISGADWQIDIFRTYGLSSVIESLSESFIQDRRVLRESKKLINTERISAKDLWYVLPYFPFLLLDKYRKYRQDMSKIGGMRQIR